MKNIELLEIGRNYKYKELCALFEEKEKTHHSREAQEKEWACYFRWSHLTKQKYRIEEIYEIPRIKEDRRKQNGGNNTSKYLALDDTIMDYVAESKEEEISCTLPQLAVKIGILSEQYQTHQRGIKAFCENNSYSLELVSSFFEKIREIVLTDIKSSLKRLKKDRHLDVQSFMVLVLVGGEKVELSGDDAARVVEIESEVCKKMGINRPEAYKEEYAKEYQKQTRLKIFEEFEYDTVNHYKIYKIRKNSNEYKRKSGEDKSRLTRRFIIIIGLTMLKFACVAEDDEMAGDLEQEESSSNIIKHIIELINYFFAYMNPMSWDEYWNDGELDLRSEEKATLFWSQYCLVKLNNDFAEKFAGKKQVQAQEVKRDIAIAEFGEDVIVKWENILGELDWERCYIDEVYTEKCCEALEAYNDTKDKFCYAKDNYIEEYCVYVARLTMQDKVVEQIPFYDFVKQFG